MSLKYITSNKYSRVRGWLRLRGGDHKFISLNSKGHNPALIISKRGYMKYLFYYLEF